MRIISPLLSGVSSLAAVLLVFAPSYTDAQDWNQVGERAQGMAGAFVAVADDASAVYWNPAGLATGSTFDAQVDLATSNAALNHPRSQTVFVGAGMPALGLAYYRVRSGVPGSGDRKTGGSGEVRVSAFDIQNFGVSLVQTLEKHVVIGSTLRLVNGQGQTGFDLDVASMASFGD